MTPPREIADSEDEDGDFDYDNDNHDDNHHDHHDHLPSTLDPLAPTTTPLLPPTAEPEPDPVLTQAAANATNASTTTTTTATATTCSTDSTDSAYFKAVYDAQTEATRRHVAELSEGSTSTAALGAQGPLDCESLSAREDRGPPVTDPDSRPDMRMTRRDVWAMPSSLDAFDHNPSPPVTRRRTATTGTTTTTKKRRSDGATPPTPASKRPKRAPVPESPLLPNTQQDADSVDLVQFPSGYPSSQGESQDIPPMATPGMVAGAGMQIDVLLDSMTRSQRRLYLSMMETSQNGSNGGLPSSGGRERWSGSTVPNTTPLRAPSSDTQHQQHPSSAGQLPKSSADQLQEAILAEEASREERAESPPPSPPRNPRAGRKGRKKRAGVVPETDAKGSDSLDLEHDSPTTEAAGPTAVEPEPAIVEIVDDDLVEEAAPAKKRGRPRKQSRGRDVVIPSDEVEVADEVPAAGVPEERLVAHDDDEAGPPQKRKRGRPRRSGQQEEDLAVEEAPLLLPQPPPPPPSPPPKITRSRGRRGRPVQPVETPMESDGQHGEGSKAVDGDDDDGIGDGSVGGGVRLETEEVGARRKATTRANKQSRVLDDQVGPNRSPVPESVDDAPKSKLKSKKRAERSVKEEPPSETPTEPPASPPPPGGDDDGERPQVVAKAEVEAEAKVLTGKENKIGSRASAMAAAAARPIYRVGLSKKSRVAPLLKIVRK